VNNQERAKQFMPFDALKGLREELKRREEKRLKERKRELSEEEIMELSRKIITLKKGERVKLTFFYDGHYVVVQDKLSEINIAFKYLAVNERRILFDDLLDVETVSD
jgi:FKBP-type peptidyl-prolyl cis-trans isomerase (trigger factor)